jgi:predicted transcriptional regulator
LPNLTPQEILLTVERLHLERTLTDLLKKARQEAGQSLAEVAKGMGVVRSRIQSVDKSENLEVQTLVRYLETLGDEVLITLIPKQPSKRVMSVRLGR